MSKFWIDLAKAPKELREGLKILSRFVPIKFVKSKKSYQIVFKPGASTLLVSIYSDTVSVSYKTANQAYRALGILNGQSHSGKPLRGFEERQRFELLNVMMDVSRNAVMNVPSLKEWLARMALMGLNSLMLYNETSYQIPGEPYFGHGLGAYTHKELKELSDFADKLGIEMFPCIQMLGHLQRLLQYQVYNDIKDTSTVLLVDEDKTYRFLDKAVKAAITPFKSKRIHIGLDETHDLGLGAYLKKNGYCSTHKVMLKHFPKVRKILDKYGLKPVMWADMYFRPLSKTGDYRDPKVKIPASLCRSVPQDIGLVYWDYYTLDAGKVRSLLKEHLKLNRNVAMAPGVQTWSRFWSNYPYAIATIKPALSVCEAEGVKEIMMTMWGDDGNECDFFSAMPMYQYYADMAFNGKEDFDRLERNLLGSCGISYREWASAGRIDAPPQFSNVNGNPSKFLLWEDFIYGIAQPQLNGISLNRYYADIATKLDSALQKKRGGMNQRLTLPLELCRVLSVKADFALRLRRAYQSGNRTVLSAILKKDIPTLRKSIRLLWQAHQSMWMQNNKVQGWDVIEQRYGGLFLRLETLTLRLKGYLSGELRELPELSEKSLRLLSFKDSRQLPEFWHGHCYSFNRSPIN